MGLLDKLGEVRARQQEKEQEELRQEEQELEARSLYFPLKSFDRILLEDLEITLWVITVPLWNTKTKRSA